MRTLLVEGDKTFKIEIPADAKITFGPWSPGKKNGFDEQRTNNGTLRIYQGTKENIVACFSGVRSFRELSAVSYAEQVAKEEGATIWKSDKNGYERQDKASRRTEWVQIDANAPKPKGRKPKGA